MFDIRSLCQCKRPHDRKGGYRWSDNLRADVESTQTFHSNEHFFLRPLSPSKFIALIGPAKPAFVDERAQVPIDELLHHPRCLFELRVCPRGDVQVQRWITLGGQRQIRVVLPLGGNIYKRKTIQLGVKEIGGILPAPESRLIYQVSREILGKLSARQKRVERGIEYLCLCGCFG
jgi:hypothetical protein